jgi:hypothetical protein
MGSTECSENVHHLRDHLLTRTAGQIHRDLLSGDTGSVFKRCRHN